MKLIINRIKIINSSKEYTFLNNLKLQYKDTNDLLELLIKKNPVEFEIEYTLKEESEESEVKVARIGGNTQITNYLSFLKDILKISINFKEFKSHVQVITEKEVNSIDKLLNLGTFEKIELSTTDGGYEEELEKVKSNLNENDKNKVNRYIEISVRIKGLETEVESFQKNKENKELNEKMLKDKEKEIGILKQKIQSTQELLKSKEDLELRYKNSLGDLINSKDVEKLKLDKYNQTINQLENIKKQQIMNVYRDEDKSNINIKYKWLIVFIVLEILIGGYLTIITSSLTTLLASITILISMVLVFITLQVINYKNTNSLKRSNLNNKDKKINNTENNGVANLNNIQDKNSEFELFKSSALSNAIKLELDKVNELIKIQLGGKEIENINKDIKALETEVNILKDKKENSVLDQDTLYKKRRELDILKIEKENIENSTALKQVVNDRLIELATINAKSQSDSKVPDKISLPIFVITFNQQVDEMLEKYKNIRQVILINEVT